MSVEGVRAAAVEQWWWKSLLSVRIIVVLTGVGKVETLVLMAMVVQKIQLHVCVSADISTEISHVKS